MDLKFTKTRDVKSPTRGTSGSAGIDFYLPENIGETASGNNVYVINNHVIFIGQGGSVRIPSGIHVKLPTGFCMTLKFDKSGVALNKKLIQGANLIDEDYQGEFSFHLINVGTEGQLLMAGEKIAQGVIMASNAHWGITEIEDTNSLYGGEITERGEGGFGSTGTK